MSDTYEFMLFRAKQELRETKEEADSAKVKYDEILKQTEEKKFEIVSSVYYFHGYIDSLREANEGVTDANLNIDAKRFLDKTLPLTEKYDELSKLCKERITDYNRLAIIHNSYLKRVEVLGFLVSNKHYYSREKYAELLEITDKMGTKTQSQRVSAAEKLTRFMRNEAEEIPPYVMEYVETWLVENQGLDKLIDN